MSLSVLIFFAILFGLVFMLRAARIGTVVAFYSPVYCRGLLF